MLGNLRMRLFHAWFRLTRPMTLGVRALVFDADGRVLLVKHSYVPGWYLPGGGVERGEPAVRSLGRELREEGGVDPLSVRVVGVYSNHRSFRNDHVILYHVDAWREVNAQDGTEILERGFFFPDDLPEGTTKATRARLSDFNADAPPPLYW